MTGPRPLLGLAALAAVALLAAGCSDEAEPARPAAATCIVQGRLGPVAADGAVRTYAESVGSATRSSVFAATAGQPGSYRIELPPGDYRLKTRVGPLAWYHTAADSISRRASDAETLRVTEAGSPYTVDFPLGGLALQGDLPAALVDASFDFGLFAPDSLTVIISGRHEAGSATLSEDFVGLAAGDYRIELRWSLGFERQGERFWLPGAARREDAARYHVEAYARTEVVLQLPSAPARLEGAVTGAWQTMGLAAPNLLLVDAAGETVLGPWRTGADGAFALPLLSPVPVKLEVEHDGLVQWLGGPDQDQATLLEPRTGETIGGLEVVGSGVRLRVLPSDQVDWSDRVTFEFHRPGATEPAFRSSQNLSYQIGLANLQPGDWLVRVVPSSWNRLGWRPQWFDRAATAATATVLTIPAGGGLVTCDLVLEAGGVIAGRLEPATSGSNWWLLALATADDGHVRALDEAYSDTRTFAFRQLLDGAYRLGLVPAGAGPTLDRPAPAGTFWYPGVTDWAAATTFTIAGADTVDGLVFSLP